MSPDQITANAFANSWNHLPAGSVYDRQQFEEWLRPLTQADVYDKKVLELGCGNGSLLVHLAAWSPASIEGVDLGDSVQSAQANLAQAGHPQWKITQADMVEFRGNGYDLVYSIGVLHHLKAPKRGLDSVIENVRPGGRFHCWVYAREGNALIIHLVDPLRKVASRLPWWFTKYCLAAPLVLPYYGYAKLLSRLQNLAWVRKLPLFEYSVWIAKRPLRFFWHVAFDQLVTPQTCYLDRNTISGWLYSYPQIDKDSLYIVMRNGNSWIFGGKKKEDD
jgi:SAM-dependent methyltransferase